MPRPNPNEGERHKNAQRYSMNENRILFIQPILCQYFGDESCLTSELNALAQEITKEYGIKVDRQARRFKSQFLCWYSENWDIIKSFMDSHPWCTIEASSKVRMNQSPKFNRTQFTLSLVTAEQKPFVTSNTALQSDDFKPNEYESSNFFINNNTEFPEQVNGDDIFFDGFLSFSSEDLDISLF